MQASSSLTAFLVAGVVLIGVIVLLSRADTSPKAESSSSPDNAAAPSENLDGGADVRLATFGSGCFWCTEAVFQELAGVHRVVSGYSGGPANQASYKQVSSGQTRHAEVVQVTYDPQEVDYATLLEVFWKTHDPTTLNRQGADVGTQYRSAVFFHDEKQRELAEKYKAKLDASGVFDDPIVTEITPYEAFYPAEDYHQDFYARSPNHGYCRVVIGPKLKKFREVFGDKLKSAKKKAALAANGDARASDDQGTDWSNIDWKNRLTPEQYRVTRRAGTERPFHNAFWNEHRPGIYRCVGCGQLLFTSDSKFDAHCGWPSFDKPAKEGAIDEHEDLSLGMVRVEIRCSRCQAHLGHIFEDGPTVTGLRYCMNSAAMTFQEEGKQTVEEGGAEEPRKRAE